jgi:hypothetical protein
MSRRGVYDRPDSVFGVAWVRALWEGGQSFAIVPSMSRVDSRGGIAGIFSCCVRNMGKAWRAPGGARPGSLSVPVTCLFARTGRCKNGNDESGLHYAAHRMVYKKTPPSSLSVYARRLCAT